MGVTAAPSISFGKDSAGAGSILILIITILIIAGAFYNIFLYKSRKKQLLISIGLILLSLVNIFLYWQVSQPPHFVEGNYSLGALVPLAIPILLILAALGIRRDEKLVKSADRLR
jgi:hypothetical protein